MVPPRRDPGAVATARVSPRRVVSQGRWVAVATAAGLGWGTLDGGADIASMRGWDHACACDARDALLDLPRLCS